MLSCPSASWARPHAGRLLAALAAIGAGVAAGLGVPGRDQWVGCSSVLAAGTLITAFGFLGRRLEAGQDGLRYRTVLRWHRLEWDEIDRFEDVRVQAGDRRLSTHNLRVVAKLRSGEAVWLPVPYAGSVDAFSFEDQLRDLRAAHLHYRPGTP
ncbi:PH domain-containing protein [Streptomyces sp. NPDC058086]|uniref:PH domain-containing protein n=1 Tax=Streptomyces sp. NPDC058086 TaxID=3346334 RepID=UPI0036EE9CAC